MNLKKLGRTFWVIAAVAIMAMVLQGCGGDDNGDGGISQSMYDQVVAERDDLQDDVDALQGQVSTLQGQVSAFLTALSASDNTAALAEISRLQTDLMSLQNALDSGGDTAGALDEIDRIKGELAKIEQDAADALAAAAKADRIARADQILAAIGLETASAVKAIPSGTGAGVTAVTATRDAAGMITIDVNGATDDVYSGGETTAGSGDWNSVTMTKDDADDSTDTLVIYTDIEAPADELFTSQYVADTLANLFDNSTGLSNDEKELIAADDFPPPNTAYTYGDTARPKSFSGSIDGVVGVFTCTTTGNCAISADEDGVLTSSETWTFAPNMPNTDTVKVPDAAYVYFGWWLDAPEDNSATHDVDVFAGSTSGHAANVDAAMEGTATYTGPAAGQYATKTFVGGVQTDAAHGDFTATASLTADFEDGSAPGTIEGSVTGFNLDDGSSPSWSVKLGEADLGEDEAGFNSTAEVDFGGGLTDGTTPAGAWQGSFYNDTDPGDANSLPGTVAGTFQAVTSTASVVGAFGATKE